MVDATNHAPGAGNRPQESLSARIRRAVLWRSGSQVIAQIVQWGATFLVIRILTPADYGLFAMTQVVLMLAAMLNGMGLANALVRAPDLRREDIARVFGMLIVANLALGAIQVVAAPLVAAYYREPRVADILRVQALLYLANPLIALAQGQLARTLEFARQARVNILAALAGAGTALTGALLGWGVWALVAAPIALFGARAIGLTIAAGGVPRPSFAFRGAGAFARYGGLVAAGQFFAFVWSQADVAIAGRIVDARTLGLYATALFLVQIVVSKVVPPLNEVAFAAYARLQGTPGAVGRAFLTLVRAVMVVAMPFYMGLASAAEPIVLTALGPHWHDAAPIVAVLALSMPAYTLYVLLGPACDALGRPGIATANAAAAAVIAPLAVIVSVQWGIMALAASWVATFALLLAIGALRALPVIGVSAGQLARAAGPAVGASVAMAAVVMLVDRALPPLAAPARLGVLVAAGGAVYAGWLLVFARESIAALLSLVRPRPAG